MKDEKNVNYPGMFDLLKGITVIGIVLMHIMGIFPAQMQYEGGLAILQRFVFALPDIFSLGNATVPVLLLVCGYGFKAINMKKCIKKQSKQLLRPFLLTGAAIAVVHFICHICIFHYLPDAAKQTGIVALSHLLGLQNGFQIHGVQLYFIGSVWFLLALFEGWILLTAVMNKLPEKSHGALAVCFFVLYCLMIKLTPPWIAYPFCFGNALLCCSNLYWGVQIKKHNWLWVPLPPIAWCLLIPLAVISQFISYLPTASSASTVITLGTFFLETVGAECMAFLLMRIAVRLNCWHNWIFNKLRMIGRYSIWVICAHSIEDRGLRWYLFVEKMQGHELAAFLIMVVVRGCLIFAMCYLFYLFDKNVRRTKRQRRVSAHV